MYMYICAFLVFINPFSGLGPHYRTLRDLHSKHANDITLADLMALAAVEAAMEGMVGTCKL